MRGTRSFGMQVYSCSILTILLLAGLLIPAHAQGATINVPGDYPTIQAAVDAVTVDNTVIVVAYNAGEPYVENVVVKTSHTGLTIEGAPGERPICKGKTKLTGKPTHRNAFTIYDSNVTLSGLDIIYGVNNCIRIESTATYARIEGCYVHGWKGLLNTEEAIGGIRVLADNVEITDCVIDGADGWTQNVRFEGVAVRDVNGFTFTGNTVRNVTYVPSFWPNCGIRFSALTGGPGLRGGLLVANNTFENNQFALSCDNNGSLSSDFAINVSGNSVETEVVDVMSDIWTGGLVLYEFVDNSPEITAVLERNEIRPLDSSNGRTRGILVGEIAGGNVTIKNNFISDMDLGISSYWVGAPYETVGADGIKIYNNTLHNCREKGLDLSSGAGISTGWDIRNNIICVDDPGTSGAYGIYVPEGIDNGLSSDYNDLWLPTGYVGYWGGTSYTALGDWQGASGWDTHSIDDDPVFLADTPKIDTYSPCVDAGQVIPSVTDDFYGIIGITRTGNEYDIGAHEAVFTEIADTTPPVITGIASTVTSNSATITWETDEESDSRVDYGTDENYGLNESDPALVTNHSITLTGLTASTLYHYKVTSVDAAGNLVSSDDFEFTTLEASSGLMYVSDIQMSTKSAGPNVNAIATVTVVDTNGPVGGARVFGHWDGQTSDSDEGVTDTSGMVSLNSDKLREPNGSEPFTFTVDNVVAAEHTYDPNADIETSDSIDWPEGAPARAHQNSAEEPYPNPANPEIWMPFTLSEMEHVVIRIYDVTGRHVRTLDLGQKAPGAYINKEKAAYWDGKSESGESVASGTYFYVMEAGQFRGIKKLIIIR